MKILSVDIGTTAMKMGIFEMQANKLYLAHSLTRDYPINIYNDGLFGDIEPDKWQKAFIEGCRVLEQHTAEVEVISLSGTTPGLTAMDGDGVALYPAILMLDQRSRTQARHIIDTIGEAELLKHTANIPVAGGCSLASILWLKDNLPHIYEKTDTFGHSNTVFCKWLTGHFAIDPSSASLTALYNTTENDLNWNRQIARTFGLDVDRLPPLYHAYQSPGRIKPELARLTGLRREPPVLIGGNDAVLAAYSVGIDEPGEIFNINGTCEITMVCLPTCIPSKNYNIRTHVIDNRWFSFYVMNAGGKAFEWFKALFCSEMDTDQFFDEFIPRSIDTWLERESTVRYTPYLMGSRYSQLPLKAEFLGLTQETSREELLAALVRGLCEYQQENLKEVSRSLTLDEKIIVSGGAVNEAIVRAKQKWLRDCPYHFEAESSLKGAALLGQKFLSQS
jgi:sugar (pentulose or hexulose) kinase